MESSLIAEVGTQLVLAVLCATAVMLANIAFLLSPDSVLGLEVVLVDIIRRSLQTSQEFS
jgi:hypothetical protein